MSRFLHPSDPVLPPEEPADELSMIVQIADRCSERRLMISTATTQEKDLRIYHQVMADEAGFAALEDEMDRAAAMLAIVFGNSGP